MEKWGKRLSIAGVLVAIIFPPVLVVGIIMLLCWYFNPVWVEISSGGTKEFINRAYARTSYEGTLEIFEAINKSLRDIQDS